MQLIEHGGHELHRVDAHQRVVGRDRAERRPGADAQEQRPRGLGMQHQRDVPHPALAERPRTTHPELLTDLQAPQWGLLALGIRLLAHDDQAHHRDRDSDADR